MCPLCLVMVRLSGVVRNIRLDPMLDKFGTGRVPVQTSGHLIVVVSLSGWIGVRECGRIWGLGADRIWRLDPNYSCAGNFRWSVWGGARSVLVDSNAAPTPPSGPCSSRFALRLAP